MKVGNEQYIAELGYAFSSQPRVQIMRVLATGSVKSATRLRYLTGLSKSSLSQHMGVLLRSGMVSVTVRGKERDYVIVSNRVVDIYTALARFCFDVINSKHDPAEAEAVRNAEAREAKAIVDFEAAEENQPEEEGGAACERQADTA